MIAHALLFDLELKLFADNFVTVKRREICDYTIADGSGRTQRLGDPHIGNCYRSLARAAIFDNLPTSESAIAIKAHCGAAIGTKKQRIEPFLYRFRLRIRRLPCSDFSQHPTALGKRERRFTV